jgi:hypothetical protein
MTNEREEQQLAEQAFRRRLRRYQLDDDILQAYRGDTNGLCNYLRSDLPLWPEQRWRIADLIHRRIERKQQRGRPRGSDPVPNPAREAERLIVCEVRQLKSNVFGDKRVPRGKLNALIDRVMESNAERFDGVGNISIANIRNELKRGAKRAK